MQIKDLLPSIGRAEPSSVRSETSPGEAPADRPSSATLLFS
jgi:hypothetical protein